MSDIYFFCVFCNVMKLAPFLLVTPDETDDGEKRERKNRGILPNPLFLGTASGMCKAISQEEEEKE